MSGLTPRPSGAMPRVTLKAAVTLDGRMATRTGDSRWITSEEARREAHRMRAANDAVLVGVGTVLADDPELTVRHVDGPDPLRCVLDTELRTPPDARLVRHDSERATLLLHAPGAEPARVAAFEGLSAVELVEVARAERGLDLRAVLRELANRGVTRLLVEGGPQVHGSFLDADLVDRAAVFVAPRIVADPAALPLAAGRGVDRMADAFRLDGLEVRRFGPDVLFEGDVRRGQS